MRLTKEIRQNVIDSIVKKSTHKKKEALIAEYKAILQEVADGLYSKKVRDWMAAVPAEVKQYAFDTISSVRLKYSNGDDVRHRMLNQRYSGIPISRPIQVLADRQHSSRMKAPKKMDAKIKKLMGKMDALIDKESSIRSTITQAVFSCNTRKQLIDLYPDLAEFLPASAGTSNLPMVQAGEVRKIVTEAKKAA